MANATMNVKDIKAIMKPETQRVFKGQTMLAPFQDEKREKYKHHMDVAGDVFERARQVRREMTNDQDAKFQLIYDKVNELRKRNDEATKKSLDTLKAYADHFEESLNGRKSKWKSELKAGRDFLVKRGSNNTDHLNRMDEMIKAEHENCIKHTSEGTGPILDKLQEHRESLAQTIAQREASHNEYCENLAENLERLKKQLGLEAKARKAECSETHERARAWYAEQNDKQRLYDNSMKERLAELRQVLDTEMRDTSNSNKWVTQEMMQFMEHFQFSVATSGGKQQAAKEHLISLKEAFN
jgi:hypothetical protein